MRVVVGPRKEYMEALYGPFVNKKFAGGRHLVAKSVKTVTPTVHN